MIVGLHHVQLAMPRGEEASAREFYAGVLGMTEVPKPPHLAVRGGVWFSAGNTQVHLGVDEDFRPAKKAHPALLVRGRLAATRPMLWVLMLAFPFPYIANTAGWLTTELGRQPWVVYGLLRTRDASSPLVHPGSALFTLIGFAGLYVVLGALYLFLVLREVAHGPGPHGGAAAVGARHV